ncbi:MAG: NAD(P)-dependent oxidoreductase [Proteobacteria bacterium]|nr:NAD(P)-dependent oxidoreductase [Pseudomonadota bacterium]
MITHARDYPAAPDRTVVIGANGFVGGAIVQELRTAGADVLSLGRADVDCLDGEAAEQLARLLQPGDAVVMVAARAPVKNSGMLLENLRLLEPVVAALREVRPSHLLYISSDAVYRDSTEPLTEASCADPGSLHGVMHRARELVLQTEVTEPLGIPFAVLRPTLIYGAKEPHNGYGPNRFRRLALVGEEIVLFGEGEERRDHVDVRDVADLATRLVLQQSAGILNAATGTVTSFRDIADQVVALADKPVPVRGSSRVGPMPHDGYRPFDPAATTRAFADFKYTTLTDGLARAHREAGEAG